MSDTLEALIAQAIKELPAKSKTRAQLVETMKRRADFRARGLKAAKTKSAPKRKAKAKK